MNSSTLWSTTAPLRRPVELVQHTSIRTPSACRTWHRPSVGSIRDGYDNAMAESAVGLYETALIRRRRPWKGIDDVEYTTRAWVDWFNQRRLQEPIGHLPPPEFEAAYDRKEASADDV